MRARRSRASECATARPKPRSAPSALPLPTPKAAQLSLKIWSVFGIGQPLYVLSTCAERHGMRRRLQWLQWLQRNGGRCGACKAALHGAASTRLAGVPDASVMTPAPSCREAPQNRATYRGARQTAHLLGCLVCPELHEAIALRQVGHLVADDFDGDHCLGRGEQRVEQRLVAVVGQVPAPETGARQCQSARRHRAAASGQVR